MSDTGMVLLVIVNIMAITISAIIGVRNHALYELELIDIIEASIETRRKLLTDIEVIVRAVFEIVDRVYIDGPKTKEEIEAITELNKVFIVLVDTYISILSYRDPELNTDSRRVNLRKWEKTLNTQIETLNSIKENMIKVKELLSQ